MLRIRILLSHAAPCQDQLEEKNDVKHEVKASSQSAQKIIPQFGMHSNTKSAIGPDRLTRSSHFLSADWDTTLSTRFGNKVQDQSFHSIVFFLVVLFK